MWISFVLLSSHRLTMVVTRSIASADNCEEKLKGLQQAIIAFRSQQPSAVLHCIASRHCCVCTSGQYAFLYWHPYPIPIPGPVPMSRPKPMPMPAPMRRYTFAEKYAAVLQRVGKQVIHSGPFTPRGTHDVPVLLAQAALHNVFEIGYLGMMPSWGMM